MSVVVHTGRSWVRLDGLMNRTSEYGVRGRPVVVVLISNDGSVGHSDATVRFGPVQRALCLNPGLDLQFGSDKFSNLGLDLEGPVQQVRSR
jgi:hypothetical protein